MQRYHEKIIASLLSAVLIGIYVFLAEATVTPASRWATLIDLAKNLVPNVLAVIIVFIVLSHYRNRLADFLNEVRGTKGDNFVATPTSPANISSFIESLGERTSVSFSIIAITGEVTVRSFLNALEHSALARAQVKCQILLRSPDSSDKRRGDAVARTVETLKTFQSRFRNFRFEVRSYSSSLPLHAILCEHESERFSGLLSFYEWTPHWREISSKQTFVRTNVERTDSLLGIYVAWFRHLWGAHRIHSLLFDFDDTLFMTTSAQVKAWIGAIEYALTNEIIRYQDLQEEVRETFSTAPREARMSKITEIFLDEQNEEDIAGRLFNNSATQRIAKLIRRIRTDEREKYTELEATPIASVFADIEHLKADYQLVIVSATSEELIARVLRANNMGDLFSHILGREAHRQKWQSVENKAQHFIRISNMLGVPLERMIFVGDSNSDFKAATQVGLPFVENRYNAELHGRKSLVQKSSAKIKYFIGGKTAGELIAAVKRIEAEPADSF